MQQQPLNNLEMSAYNKAVKDSYFKILKGAKLLLSTVSQHELRCTFYRANKVTTGLNETLNELISPIIYLSLECNDGERLSIHFGFETDIYSYECSYSTLTSKFIRLLYKFTSKEHAGSNIEDCITTAFVITNCSELYEAIEDSYNKQHTFKLIAYKPTAAKRKQLMAVA